MEDGRVCDYKLRIQTDPPKVEVFTPEGTSLTEQSGDTVTACIEAIAPLVEDDIRDWGCAPSQE